MKFKTWLENMQDILAPAGVVPQIGPEKTIYKGQITKLVSPHGSTRYLYLIDDQIVSALQIVSKGKKVGIVARVTTLPEYQRQGFATALLNQARKEFQQILPAEHLSDAGSNWTNKNF